MRTIRGRILLSFLILVLLITPVLIFSFNSVRKVNNAKNLKEKVAIFNVNRLKAFNAFTSITDFDFKKDEFYLSRETENTQRFYKNLAEGNIRLKEINSVLTNEELGLKSKIVSIQKNLEQIESKIKEIIVLQRERGFADYGLEGKMREKIHSLESRSNEISLAEILSLRRREKDFFLRADFKYVNLLNEEYKAIRHNLLADSATNLDAIKALDGYKIIFDEIVKKEAAIGNETKGLIAEISKLNKELDNESSMVYNTVSKDYENLINSIRTYLLVFLGLTTVFAILFSLVFSSYIAKPLNKLIHDMTEISKNGFQGKKQLKAKYPIVEIEKLTKSYNEVVDEIRTQIEELNDKNFELNEINFKLTESENELKEASKLKDKFFSIISHDLRGHTGNVLSLAQILNQNHTISDKEKSVFTKYLIDSSQSLQLLLDNLLNWAKTQMNDHEMAKRSFNISNLITKNIGLYQENALRKGVAVNYEKNLNANAYADKDMIDFVIRNLLSNALKFTTKGDSITFSITEKNDYLRIHVEDTGVGMTLDQIQKLLGDADDTFTTEGTEKEKGTGLGFSICKDFVQRNGGKIYIDSEIGQGSEFTFSVPTSLTRQALSSVP